MTKESAVSDMMSDVMVFSGNANPALAKKVAHHLGIPLGDMTAGKFSDGEINIVLNENVRGKDAFIFQSTCYPTNDNIMELVIRRVLCSD